MATLSLSPEFLPFWGRLVDVSSDDMDPDEALDFAEMSPGRPVDVAASASLVADLPSVLSSEEVVTNGVCCICMEGFDGSDQSAKRVPCGHVYHGDCISSWLSHSDSCPLCRCIVYPSSSSTGQ